MVPRDQVAVSGGAVRAGFGGSESGIKPPSLVLLAPCRAPCSFSGGVGIFGSQFSETKYFVFVSVVAVIIVVSVFSQLSTQVSSSTISLRRSRKDESGSQPQQMRAPNHNNEPVRMFLPPENPGKILFLSVSDCFQSAFGARGCRRPIGVQSENSKAARSNSKVCFPEGSTLS